MNLEFTLAEISTILNDLPLEKKISIVKDIYGPKLKQPFKVVVVEEKNSSHQNISCSETTEHELLKKLSRFYYMSNGDARRLILSTLGWSGDKCEDILSMVDGAFNRHLKNNPIETINKYFEENGVHPHVFWNAIA